MTPNSRLGHNLARWVAISHRHPWAIVAAFVVVGAVAGLLASRLAFRGDFVELLPEKSEEVRDLRFVEERAGGAGYFVVQVVGGTREQRQAFSREYAPRLEAHADLVRFVESRFDIDFFRKRSLWLLSAQKLEALKEDLRARIDYEKKVANPLYVDLEPEAAPPDFAAIEKKYGSDAPKSEYPESQDQLELYLYARPAKLAADLEFNRRLMSMARAEADALLGNYPQLTVSFTGDHVIRVEEDTEMQRDLARGAGLASLISFGIILLASRRISALLIVGAPVGVGIAATFAFAYFIVGHLNPVTGFLGAILIGLGIEYGVHLAMRYWEERTQYDAKQAMMNAVLGSFEGALTSAGTNAAAFFVLVFAEFEAFKQFGKISAFGVLATVLCAYLLGPSILFIADRIRPPKRSPHAPTPDGAARVKAGGFLPRPVLFAAMGAIALFAAYSLSVLPHVGFETNLRSLKGKAPATDLYDHIVEQLGIRLTPALLHVATLEEARIAASVASEVKARRGGDTAIDRIASLNDFTPQDLDARRAQITEIGALLADLPKSVLKDPRTQELVAVTQSQPWAVEEVPLEIRRRFTALSGGGYFVLLFPRYTGYRVEELDAWRADLNDILAGVRGRGIEAHVLDGNRIAGRILSLIKQDGPFVMGAAAVVVFCMIWLSLRSVKRAALVAGPLYLGMTCVIGAMYLWNVRLNFLNVVVLPNLLAIAVDNSVHLFHRYREEGKGTLGHIMRTTGFAAVIATLSNAAGYGAMLVAQHNGLKSVGLMAMLGVSCTFLGTTVFFPALLGILEGTKSPPTAPMAEAPPPA